MVQTGEILSIPCLSCVACVMVYSHVAYALLYGFPFSTPNILYSLRISPVAERALFRGKKGSSREGGHKVGYLLSGVISSASSALDSHSVRSLSSPKRTYPYNSGELHRKITADNTRIVQVHQTYPTTSTTGCIPISHRYNRR